MEIKTFFFKVSRESDKYKDEQRLSNIQVLGVPEEQNQSKRAK